MIAVTHTLGEVSEVLRREVSYSSNCRMSAYLDSYHGRLCQNDRCLSLDRTLTTRRVLHVNGGFMPPFMIWTFEAARETKAIRGATLTKPDVRGSLRLLG